jgi:hypothetical protein
VQTLSSLISEPTENDRKAFASVAGGNAPAMTFTREQLKLIADALLTHEVDLVRGSQMFTTRAEKAATAEAVSRDLAHADRLFCQSCDARELSEKISAELRRTRA